MKCCSCGNDSDHASSEPEPGKPPRGISRFFHCHRVKTSATLSTLEAPWVGSAPISPPPGLQFSPHPRALTGSQQKTGVACEPQLLCPPQHLTLSLQPRDMLGSPAPCPVLGPGHSLEVFLLQVVLRKCSKKGNNKYGVIQMNRMSSGELMSLTTHPSL